MRMRLRSFAILYILSLVSACGDGETQRMVRAVYRCDYRNTAEPNTFCYEFTDEGEATTEGIANQMSACAGGAWTQMPCGTQGAIGSCAVYRASTATGGLVVTMWLYDKNLDGEETCTSMFPGAEWTER
jgi:hypothetical protein